MNGAPLGSIRVQAQDLGADATDTVVVAIHRFNEFMRFQLIDAQGVKLTIGALVGALLSLLVALLVSRLMRAGLDRYATRHENNQAALYTLSRIIHYVMLLVGVLVALSVAGIPLSRFELFAGALGVGLGFGLQAIFSNFVSGLIILFDRSLKVGDFVELSNGVHGVVNDIHIRATRITTNDNIDILVPNSEFVTNNVVNWTLRETSRRLRVPFGVAYGTDKERVKQAALEAAAEVPFTLTLDGPRMPQVWLTGFGDSSLDFALVVWLNAEAVKRPSAVTAAYNWALHSALENYGIEIPFPQRDLHVKSWVEPPSGRAGERHEPRPSATARDAHRALSDNDAARDMERGGEEAKAREAEAARDREDARR